MIAGSQGHCAGGSDAKKSHGFDEAERPSPELSPGKRGPVTYGTAGCGPCDAECRTMV